MISSLTIQNQQKIDNNTKLFNKQLEDLNKEINEYKKNIEKKDSGQDDMLRVLTLISDQLKMLGKELGGIQPTATASPAGKPSPSPSKTSLSSSDKGKTSNSSPQRLQKEREKEKEPAGSSLQSKSSAPQNTTKPTQTEYDPTSDINLFKQEHLVSEKAGVYKEIYEKITNNKGTTVSEDNLRRVVAMGRDLPSNLTNELFIINNKYLKDMEKEMKDFEASTFGIEDARKKLRSSIIPENEIDNVKKDINEYQKIMEKTKKKMHDLKKQFTETKETYDTLLKELNIQLSTLENILHKRAASPERRTAPQKTASATTPKNQSLSNLGFPQYEHYLTTELDDLHGNSRTLDEKIKVFNNLYKKVTENKNKKISEVVSKDDLINLMKEGSIILKQVDKESQDLIDRHNRTKRNSNDRLKIYEKSLEEETTALGSNIDDSNKKRIATIENNIQFFTKAIRDANNNIIKTNYTMDTYKTSLRTQLADLQNLINNYK